MQIQVFGIIVLVVGMISLYVPYQWSIFSMTICCLFACTSTLAVGGVGILPANLFLLFFSVKAYSMGGGAMFRDSIGFGKPGFWLACLCAWAVVSALLLPRAFAGSTFVYAISRSAADPNQTGMQPLGPVSGNLTQSVYCIGELILYCSMSHFLTKPGGYAYFAKAMITLCAMNALAGVIDLASHAAGLNVLGAIKTADYVLHDGEELGGLMRVTGTFSEASGFSGFTVPLFAFSANLWMLGYRQRITGLLSIASLALLLVSTSATAYVGVGGYLLVLLASRPERLVRDAGRRKLYLFIAVACAGVLGAIYAMLFAPALLDAIGGFFGDTLLNKASSDSGVERGAWNAQAIENFIDTYGLGVGLGSTRVSSFLLVVLSNLGIIGGICFIAFATRILFTRISTQRPIADRIVCYAARQSMIALFIPAAVSGTVFDLGAGSYLVAAAAAGLAVSARPFACAVARERPGKFARVNLVDSIVRKQEVETALPPAPPRPRVPAWPART